MMKLVKNNMNMLELNLTIVKYLKAFLKAIMNFLTSAGLVKRMRIPVGIRLR